jgi:hypothetical protein
LKHNQIPLKTQSQINSSCQRTKSKVHNLPEDSKIFVRVRSSKQFFTWMPAQANSHSKNVIFEVGYLICTLLILVRFTAEEYKFYERKISSCEMLQKSTTMRINFIFLVIWKLLIFLMHMIYSLVQRVTRIWVLSFL